MAKTLKKYYEHHLVKCIYCDFIFSNQVPTPEELDDIYNSYKYEAVVSTSATLSKKSIIARSLLERSAGTTVLDVGCGMGEWLDAFRDLGCKTYGTEYSSHQKRTAESKGHIIMDGGLFPLPPSELIFDIIIFTEVIEHIQNPLAVLKHFNRVLKNGGYILITTPNWSAIERLLLGRKWGMICYPEHLAYFTPKTLDLALQRAGFQRYKMHTENLSVYRILQSFGAKKSSREKASDALQTLTATNPIFARVKVFVNKCLDVFGIGVSIVAIYQKTGDVSADQGQF